MQYKLLAPSGLANADLVAQANPVLFQNAVERAPVFFLEPLAQVLGGDEARLAVGQVAPGALPELHERRVGQAQNDGRAIYKELRVDGVAVPRGNAVPHVREPALMRLAGKFRGHFKSTHKRAHRARIGERRPRYRFLPLLVGFRWHPFDLAGFLAGRPWSCPARFSD